MGKQHLTDRGFAIGEPPHRADLVAGFAASMIVSPSTPAQP
jgi:hypothetical protein